jgi:hypothetical protein
MCLLDGEAYELIQRPWVDFSTNRNEALKLAKKYGDYALVIDADDVLDADPDFSWPAPTAPGYLLEILYNELRYRRVALPRLDAGWEWKGVLHEVLVSPLLAQAQFLPKMRIHIHNDGARSLQSPAEKFTRDAEILRMALGKEPDHARNRFYLAQSLRDAGDLPSAIAEYEKRAAMGGWAEEVYFSRLQIAVLKERSCASYADVVAAYLDAHDSRPTRAEAPCELARYFRLCQRWNLARHFAQIAANLPVPEDVLFIDNAVHDWRARDEWAIACYWCGDYAQSAALCRELLAGPHLPAQERERVQKNLEFSLPHLAEST